jgi:triosephosphate isomerase
MEKIIIANWKANPSTLAEAQELFRAEAAEAAKYENIQTVICPPLIFLEELAKERQVVGEKRRVQLGAQDLSFEPVGPFTGETPAQMLKNFGVSHVLVGHSDRRYKIGEADEMINQKIKAALQAGIIPALLVGEKNREDDRRQVLERQLSADLAGLALEEIAKILIAYEPVWAISTTSGAEPDTPENTLEAIKIIQKLLGFRFQVSGFRFLYGGSVNSKNVADFLKHPEISGAVIGGASLRKDEFASILKIVSGIK